MYQSLKHYIGEVSCFSDRNFDRNTYCLTIPTIFLKVSKSQKQFFLKLNCQKTNDNFCPTFRSFFGQWIFKKKCFKIRCWNIIWWQVTIFLSAKADNRGIIQEFQSEFNSEKQPTSPNVWSVLFDHFICINISRDFLLEKTC